VQHELQRNSDPMILYDNNKDLVEIYNRDFYVYMSLCLYTVTEIYMWFIYDPMIHVPMSYITRTIAIVPEKKTNKTNM
jgi:hypothetical protein